MEKIIFTLIVFLSLVIQLDAQNKGKKRFINRQPFQAGLVFGFNAAQIDGDYQFGYKQIGFSFGARGTARLSRQLMLSMDLLYSQKGAKSSHRGFLSQGLEEIVLNYAETPIVLNILTKENEEDNFYTVHLQAGVSYGRLLNYKVEERLYIANPASNQNESTFSEISENFSRNDISWVLGLSYYFNRHIGLTFRHTTSARLLFNSEDIPEEINRDMRSYFYTFQLVYMF